MSVTINPHQVYTDFQGLAEMKHKADDQSAESLRAAAQQFEALFIQQMLKSMRDAQLSDGIFESDQSEFYLDMFDKQMSLNLAQGQGIGLADMLVEQLSKSLNLQESTKLDEKNQGLLQPTNNLSIQSKNSDLHTLLNSDNIKKIADPQSFIHTFWPLAKKAGEKIGVQPQVLLAQAALETGWGQFVGRSEEGESSHNLFNIKAGSTWPGRTVTRATMEFNNGGMVKEYASFRAYDSFNDSFDDYVSFLQSSPRYQDALQKSNNPQAFTSALQDAGYATDPLYSRKLMDIVSGVTMKNAISSLKV